MGFLDLFKKKILNNEEQDVIKCATCLRIINGRVLTFDGKLYCSQCHQHQLTIFRQTGGVVPAALKPPQAPASNPTTFICSVCRKSLEQKYRHKGNICAQCAASSTLVQKAAAPAAVTASRMAPPSAPVSVQKPTPSPVQLPVKAEAPARSPQQRFDEEARKKEAAPAVNSTKLTGIYTEYFKPAEGHLIPAGSPHRSAYFDALSAATDEILANPALFTAATKWPPAAVQHLLDNASPSTARVFMCGLIFTMGNYAVIKSNVFCVDFSEAIPYCIALYLLLTAQKLPENKRLQELDVGEGTNDKPLSCAIDTLRALDPLWHCEIL